MLLQNVKNVSVITIQNISKKKKMNKTGMLSEDELAAQHAVMMVALITYMVKHFFLFIYKHYD